MKHLYPLICVGLLVWGGILPGARALAQRVVYVDADASGMNDGSSWTDAYPSLQDALAAALAGDEIWVVEGIYKPVAPADSANVTDGDRTVSFELKNGVALYGGFVGTEAARDERDVASHPTILSGDLLSNDNENVVPDEPTRSDNSWSVVNANIGIDETAVLDGFTITGGNANPPPQNPNDTGGGLYVTSSSPTVRNIRFIANTARFGGGLGCLLASPTVTNVVFINNAASENGGGLYTFASSPTMRHLHFQDNVSNMSNTSAGRGGGLHNDGSAALMFHLTFIDNMAFRGGGVSSARDNSVLTNAVFLGNVATEYGGGMFNDGSSTVLMNAVFSGNRTLDPDRRGGGAIGNSLNEIGQPGPFIANATISGNTAAKDGGAVLNISSSPTIINSVLWANQAGDRGPEMLNLGSNTAPSIFNSIVGGGLPDGAVDGGGNLDADPLFADFDGADGVVGTADDDLRLMLGSPAIDAGRNDGLVFDLLDLDDDGDTGEGVPIDLDGLARIHDGGSGIAVVDLGAYEFGAPPILPVAVAGPEGDLPEAPVLLSAYPNPFRDQATLRYELPTSGRVVLKVYDTLGREVATLVDGIQPSGAHEVPFDAIGLASGLYLYRLETERRAVTRKMLLVK